MGYIAYLERNGARINFDGSGVYHLAPGFVPPTISLQATYANGTSAARYTPSVKISERVQSQSISIPFHLRGLSSDTQANDAIDRINSFLRDAGDENYPTYFVWLSNNDVPHVPRFGQSVRRLLIAEGAAYHSQRYSEASLNQQGLPNCRLDLVVSAIEGLPTQFGMARGGIFDMTAETVDKMPFGVVIPPVSATGGNYHTNPIFGRIPFNGGWTTAAGLVVSENTDPQYVYAGTSSAKISRISSSNITLTQSLTLTVDTYCFSFYAKRPDGAAVTASEIVAFYDGDLATTYMPMSNGWYRCFGTATGVASAKNTGVAVKANREIYVDGFQAERLAYPTPLFHGDMLGCAWSSTAHASASTRLVSILKYPHNDVINLHAGTVEIVWRAPFNSTSAPADMYIFDTDPVTSLSLRWVQASNVWRLSDGTNSASTSATTFTGGTTYTFHAVWSQVSGLALYINGASVATNATYTAYAWTAGDSFFLGTERTNANHSMGVISGLVSWSRALTSTQVLARYSNIVPLISSYRPTSLAPWLWTIDGDGVIDKATSATDAAYGVIGGVGGDVPTEPTFLAYNANGYNVYGGCIESDSYIGGSNFYDTDTTARPIADAPTLSFSFTAREYKNLVGKKLTLFFETNDAGTGGIFTWLQTMSGSDFVENTARDTVIDPPGAAAYRFYAMTGVSVPSDLIPVNNTVTFSVSLYMTAGGAGNVTQTGILVPGNVFWIPAGRTYITLQGRKANSCNYASGIVTTGFPVSFIGDSLVLHPAKVNTIFLTASNAFADVGLNPVTVILAKYTPSYLSA